MYNVKMYKHTSGVVFWKTKFGAILYTGCFIEHVQPLFGRKIHRFYGNLNISKKKNLYKKKYIIICWAFKGVSIRVVFKIH